MSITTSFNGSVDLNKFIEDIYSGIAYKSDKTHVEPLVTFNEYLFKYFYPDINGYCMVFFVPPPFKSMKKFNKPFYDQQYVELMQKTTIFAAIDFTPPNISVESEVTSARTGGIPYATEIRPSQQCSVTWIDHHDLDIYNFHNNWVTYMHDLLEGYLEPHPSYLDYNDELYGGLDYAASFFFIKFDPDVRTVKYVAKATGVFPQQLPSKELIGTRASNEVTTLPFNYNCAFFEETFQKHHPIWEDFENHVLQLFKGY